MNDTPTLIVIAGPTASGKTAAGIELARHYHTVVVSADSRQFYREMTVGTAKPAAEELAAARHYFVDSLSITENYTAGTYENECLLLLDALFKEHKVVVMVGGSGLFIKAVCEGFDKFPDIDPSIREKLNNELADKGIGYLQEKLMAADPVYYGQADINNPQRIIRALEVAEGTGNPYSSYRRSSPEKRPFNVIKLGLNMPREKLYARIDRRVDEMVKNGLIEEVRSLIPFKHLNPLHTVGYTEIFDYFDEKTNLETAINFVKQNTRRYAKRQLTWFGKDQDMKWFDASDQALSINILYEVETRLAGN
ncbi:MAG TPA: tRNA (adenosine(37)-N6)-dimethylallyltransferase MiaA [Mucilaginibacter sp.]|nr:tRNA (adenosine(37)-N6)-dimethylallyltransferase MiaA [Mucilaginibacter sp.]